MSLEQVEDFGKNEVEAVECVPNSKDVEVGGHIDGDVRLLDQSGAVRLVPVPTSSPRDPLNWPRHRKVLLMLACCWYSVMSLSLIGGIGPVLPFFMRIYVPTGTSVTDVLKLVTWPGLFVGLGNFVFLPLALATGRRFAFLVSTVVLLGATIGGALCKSFQGNLTARIFQGLAAGITESLLPLIIADVTFIHERARYFGYYSEWTSQSIISSLLSLASSYEAAALGWRWYYGIFAITVFVGILLAFFFCPETRFQRPAANIDGQIVVTDQYGEMRVLSDEEAANLSSQDMDSDMRPATYTEGLKVWNGLSPNGWRLALESYVGMAKCLTSPAMLWAVAYAGIVLGVSIGFSLTYGDLLTDDFSWPIANTGLIQIGTIPAGLAALWYTGFFMDRMAVRSAKKNGGQHRPEARLPLVALPSVIGVVSTIIYGFAVSDPPKYGWATIVVMNSVFQFTFVCSLIFVTTFGVEVCSHVPGPALVIAVGLKNVVAFGLSFGISSLVTTKPGKESYGILAGVLAGISLLTVPVYFINARWRKAASGRLA